MKIFPHNPRWPEMFLSEEASIQEALGSNCIAVHHVGSTSVNKLISRPIIDIAIEVKSRSASVLTLAKLGYDCCGEANIPFRLYCIKKMKNIEIHLHVYEGGSVEVKRHLMFRDYLRSNPEACAEYVDLPNNNSLAKHMFIQAVLAKAGFDGLQLTFCTHPNEWQAYHRIREEQLFTPTRTIYDRAHPSLSSEDFHHFVLYKGVNIVAVATVEFPRESYAILRSLATDEQHKKKGYGTYMLILLEGWMKQHGYSVVKLHAAPNAESFYRQLGYVNMEFDDLSITPDAVDLGKKL